MNPPCDPITTRPRPVFLVGMMGAGKTTMGRSLATRLGCRFVDLDQRIERIWGLSISESFATGEAHFRRREQAALQSLTREPGFTRRVVVVATGGGVLTTPGSRELMRCGVVVHLAVPADRLAERLSSPEALAARPVLAAWSAEADGPAAGGTRSTGATSPDITHAGTPLGDRIHRLLEARKAGYETADLEVDASASVEEVVTSILAQISPSLAAPPPEPRPHP